MSKAILILDKMPESCMECDVFNHEYLTCLGCKVNFGELSKVQSWCPLKPLPERINPLKVDASNLLDLGYMHGRNDLINQLEGDEDE